MKKILIHLCCVTLLIALSLSFYSCSQEPDAASSVITEQWDEKLIKSDPKGVTYSHYFESVENLLSAIKHDPEKYNNAKVKVVGTVQKFFSSEAKYDGRLVDFVATSTNTPSSLDGVMERYNFNQTLGGSKYDIYLNILNDAQYAVASDGDYVKIYGTVKLERDNIYIEVNKYDLIATLDERRQNINDRK